MRLVSAANGRIQGKIGSIRTWFDDLHLSATRSATMSSYFAGTVEAAGPDAKGATPGKFYAAYPWIGCGKCWHCGNGQENLCGTPRAMGAST